MHLQCTCFEKHEGTVKWKTWKRIKLCWAGFRFKLAFVNDAVLTARVLICLFDNLKKITVKLLHLSLSTLLLYYFSLLRIKLKVFLNTVSWCSAQDWILLKFVRQCELIYIIMDDCLADNCIISQRVGRVCIFPELKRLLLLLLLEPRQKQSI